MIPVLFGLVALAAVVGAVMWIAYVIHRDGPSRPPRDIPAHASRIASEHPEGASR